MLTPPKENFYRQKVWKTLTEIVRDFSFVITVIGPINAFLDIFLDGFDPEFMQSNKGRRLSAIISAFYNKLGSFSRHFEIASMLTAFVEFLERLNPNTNNALLVRFMIAKAALFGVVMSTTCIPRKIGNTITERAQSTAKALGVKIFMDKLKPKMFYAGIFVVAEAVYFVYATPETLIILSLATSAAVVAICTTNIVRTLKSSASEELTLLLTNAHEDPEAPSPPLSKIGK